MTAPLKFVFYRPHTNIWFRNPIGRILRNARIPNKYGSFFDYAINSEAEIYLASTVIPGDGAKGGWRSLRDAIHLILWCVLNKLSLYKIRFVFSRKGLLGKDVLFVMHYGNFTDESSEGAQRGKELAQSLAEIPIYKVVHMTHYVYNPVIGFENLSIFSPNLLVAENNLSRNSAFFSRFFAALGTAFDVLPYTPAPRFKKRTPFRDRSCKLVVTGSITFKMRDEHFLDFYGVTELQPLRRMLFERAAEYGAEMECQISDLNAAREEHSNEEVGSVFKRMLDILKKRNPHGDYYKKDIVTAYNEHMMFAVPEEICDLPAIGAVEGMACGCAYFGLDNAMYRDLGLIPGVHYVSYDGTVPDLMTKVRYYQQNLDKLEEIAFQGHEFVCSKLIPEIVYRKFFNSLRVACAKEE